MKRESVVSFLLGIGGLTLFTTLLVRGTVSQLTYFGLLMPLALVCIVILCLPRLQELDLKNLRLTLSELKQVKAEIAEMYGGIENLRKAPFVLDDTKMKELGAQSTVAFTSVVMRYPAGCIKRERERLARIFVNEKSPQKIAEAILDNSLDDKVFKWNGPETPLDQEPVPIIDPPESNEAAK